MKKIVVRKVPENVSVLHANPLLHRIYAARGVQDACDLEYDLKNLLSYETLGGIVPAVELLSSALQNQHHVLVVGDFDTDGATSTALTILSLKAFGLNNISYLIPDRFKYGYGLTPEIVAVAAAKKPDLIITVDNGISSNEGVAAANNLGIKVLITDHHLPGDVLPSAAAIVNPNLPNDQFPSKCLAGVGVVFYLMLALRARLRESDWFCDKVLPNMAQFLDLVALGTIADAVTLDYNNRILVSQGITRIRAGKGCLGIRALFAAAKRNYEKAAVHDLGFIIAPRLNAAGRLDDMALGVECLIADDPIKTRAIAKELGALNDERRDIEKDMHSQATRLVDDLKLEQALPPGLCIFEESWHQGILGILAGRLKDKLHRPVIAFAAVDDGQIKGSARSLGNVHIRDILSNIATKNPGLITKFGGHALAAGLSMPQENYPFFAQIFAEEVSRHVTLDDLNGIVDTDGELSHEHLDLATAELLSVAGPWGAGFTEPLFFGEFTIVKQQLVGTNHLKLVLNVSTKGSEIDAICFNVDPNLWPNSRYSRLKIVYRLGVNEYNNRKKLQLLISEIIHCE